MSNLGKSWMPLGHPWDTSSLQDWATLNMHDPVLVEFHLVPLEQSPQSPQSQMPRSFGRRSAALQLVPVVLALALAWPRTSS